MRIRYGASGPQLYDRVTGTHLLFDEVACPRDRISSGPSVVSVAVTYRCNLRCPFCYAPKLDVDLRAEDLAGWCMELDALGTLEVALGGGEPLLYPDIAGLCHKIWHNSGLGVSVTTNGHLLSPALMEKLEGSLSILRVSIDAPEPLYRQMRGADLGPVLAVLEGRSRLRLGVNTVVNRLTMEHLDELASVVTAIGANDWLLLPEVLHGQFVLSDDDWRRLDAWLARNWDRFGLRLAAAAAGFVTCPMLLDTPSEHDYAHIGADGLIYKTSYGGQGVALQGRPMRVALEELYGEKRGRDRGRVPR